MELQNYIEPKTRGIFGSDLSLDRTKRIYNSLGALAGTAVGFLNSGKLKDFSFASDKMRPLLSYINDNSILISRHLKDGTDDNPIISKLKAEIIQLTSALTQNLKTIDNARAAMGQVDFSPVFFKSDDLTHAYLDSQIPLAWEFEHDLVIVLNPDDRKPIDILAERGQKRIFLVQGSLDPKILLESYPPGVILHRTNDYRELEDLMTSFPERPPKRLVVLDFGQKKTEPEIMEEIKALLTQGREMAWLRFNTINRGDAIKIFNNLYNMSVNQQASEFHGNFKGKGAVIVCPGPSLKKNIHLIHKLKGKVLIICVLHALRALREAGVTPDIVIHTDPQNLKELNFERDGEQVTYWNEWIERNDLSGVSYFAISVSASPDMFRLPSEKVMWMSAGLSIGDFLPTEIFDYTRVGGSVSHSAFDLAVEFGCESIALVGQDLALDINGVLYESKSALDESEQDKEKRIEKLGHKFFVEGINGKQVETNASFSFFAKSYTRFAKQLMNEEITLYNCTEGGRQIDGFENSTLQEYIDRELKKTDTKEIDIIFAENNRSAEKTASEKKYIRRYVTKNIVLANEIEKNLKTAITIAKKDYHTDQELMRFDTVQHKVIKKMKQNFFYTLGLQREMYILGAGLGADRSEKGQLGFHLDFLRSARRFNNAIKQALTIQSNFFNRH